MKKMTKQNHRDNNGKQRPRANRTKHQVENITLTNRKEKNTMTKQELEIRYKVLEERMERIYELCKKYTGISNGAETIGEIEANCDPDIIEQIINWRI